MDTDEPLQRLQNLQRDLIAFAESRLPNLDRLAAELDASLEDFRKLLDKKQKNEASRAKLMPGSTDKPSAIELGGIEYEVNDNFRQAALLVADELNLDELEAAKLCIDAAPLDQSNSDSALPYRAILCFHEQRQILLGCLQQLLHQSIDSNEDSDITTNLRTFLAEVVRVPGQEPPDFSPYWNKCISALSEIEAAVKKVGDHKQALIMTGQNPTSEVGDALDAQRVLLTRQHESLAAVMTYLIRGNYVNHQGFRSFITKTAALESPVDITVHYLPILISGAAYFGSGDGTPSEAALDLHKLFAAGPAQMQYKQPQLKAAATVFWLAEYSARFTDTLADPMLRVADRQKAEEDRATLFFDALKEKALHFILAGCVSFRPEIWHNPARIGLVEFLLSETPRSAPDAPKASEEFAKVAMGELQIFTESFVSHMPDVLRRLKLREDDRRRDNYSRPPSEAQHYEPDLERFIVIMSYAYQDDPDAAQDFWADREGNLYGFLRWVSQRLPTPRVAAFCDLLGSIANDVKTANHAHRFLLEDTVMMSGKLRKAYNVSWSQIFNELETFASSLKDRPAAPQIGVQDMQDPDLIESETGIMLESYLRLAAHICRISPEARNWILREQTFHLADVLFQLASSSIESRIQACCFDLLAALLTEKIGEVNDGMWVMLDNWIAGGGSPGAATVRQPVTGNPAPSERYYLQRFGDNPETAAAFVGLLNALVAPLPAQSEPTLDALPFPENLGAAHRHAGIDSYVDFVVGTAFRMSTAHLRNGYDESYVHVLRCTALEFMLLCLSTFNEDLVLLANTTNVGVDAAIRCSSLAAYARLHPFARVMDWLLNNNVIDILGMTIQHFGTDLNELDPTSPQVLATLKAIQVLNFAMRLQATYFDLVRPLIKSQESSSALAVGNGTFTSVDDVILSQLPAVVDTVSYITSKHLELSVESLSLLQTLANSKRLNAFADLGAGPAYVGNRLVGLLAGSADIIAAGLQNDFQIYEHDLELGTVPPKLVRAAAVLDLLVKSLNTSIRRPGIAHCLLGFDCHDQSVSIQSDGLFAQGASLFHNIAACAAQGPISIAPNYVSWLLSVKRGCLEVISILALSPLTASIVRPELRLMDFLAACSTNQVRAFMEPLWDSRALTDVELLLDGSASAIRDFLHVRELFFKYASLELHAASEVKAYSILEKATSALCGVIQFPSGEQEPTLSVFDLFDFFDMETVPASEATCRFFGEIDLSICLKDDSELNTVYNLEMAEELLILKKRELVNAGAIKDSSEEQQLDDELRAILASLQSQNSWSVIQRARLTALEAWCDLISVLINEGGLDRSAVTALALQTLQATLAKFERSLTESIQSAQFLAKLILTLVSAASSSEETIASEHTIANHERLLLAFRVCLKAITDGGSDLALRDVCYRTCCLVISAVPLSVVNGKVTPSPSARQLSQLVQLAGERVFSVITEDAFSGRGTTRVSAILCLDALVVLFQSTRTNAQLIKVLSKLNFVPVLIDMSIGNVAASFQGQTDELTTTIAYFHVALALLLRICQTPDGAQLVLNAGLFDAVTDSRLFSTDPDIGLDVDNPTALRQFYMLLSAVLRVVTAIVLARGPSNMATIQQARSFLQRNRFCMQAVFKRTSAVHRTAGPPEPQALEVADEFGRLMLVTGFLEDDEPQHERIAKVNGFA